MQNSDSPCKCPHCGASLEQRAHRLSKGLVKTLVLFKISVCELDRNEIHLRNDMSLSKNQYNNFQKLRYHGLVAKCYEKDTKLRKSGYWLLTRRGNRFLKHNLAVPVRVSTFRNKIVERDEKCLTINEILTDSSLPVWDNIEKYGSNLSYPHQIDLEDISKDMYGQTLLFV